MNSDTERIEWLQALAAEIPFRLDGDRDRFTIWINRVETLPAASLREAIDSAMELIA